MTENKLKPWILLNPFFPRLKNFLETRFLKLFILKTLCLVFLLIVTMESDATNYYVSNSGNNLKNGRSADSAWQTIDKVNSFTFASGDSILFNRGDVFYGGIVVHRSGLNYGSYGTGAKPVITGLSTITGWVNLGGNIWEAPTVNVKSTNNLVTRNGVIQQIGRFPNTDDVNKGYLTNTAAGSTFITGPALSATTNWTGAEVVFRTNRWTIDRQIVTSHSGGTVNFAANPTVPNVGFGYFFQRDARTVNEDGEWFQNGATNKLRMYFGNNNPAAYTIEAATVDTLLKSTSGSLTISNLSFYGSGRAAIRIDGATGVTITNCDVNTSGADAITTWFCTNITVIGCTTNNSLGSGIRIKGSSTGTRNYLVQNCTIQNTCLVAGMEESNVSNSGNALECKGGDNISVLNNKVVNSGYNAIEWQGNNVAIKYNLADSFCSVRDDGAGIYTWEAATGSTLPTRTNRYEISNIVLNGIGAPAGANASSGLESSVNGIYLDDGTRTVTVDSNTVANIGANGLHGNSNSYDTITNNTFFNTKFSLSQQRFGASPLIRGMVIKKNIFYPYRFRYRNLGINSPTLITKEADILAMGIIDSNYYSLRSGTDTSLTTVTTYADKSHYLEGYYNFSYLTGTIGVETHSTHVSNTGTLAYNAGNTDTTINLGSTSYLGVDGTLYNNNLILGPHSSKVLIPNGTCSLPAGWSTKDIGLITPPGSTCVSAGVFTVKGSGTDIYNNADAFRFTYQQVSGNFTIIAKLNSFSATGTYAKAGLMIRETLNSGSKNAFVNIRPYAGSNLQFQYRQTTDSATIDGTGTTSVSFPYWLKFARSGNTIKGYISADGVTWVAKDTLTISMGDPVYMGLAVDNFGNGNLATAIFDSVSVQCLLPDDWSTKDIGTTTPAGSACENAGTYTVKGSGDDIFGNGDSFRFMYKKITGSNTIIAKLNSFSATGTYAKAGLMIRETLNSGSKNAFVNIRPYTGSNLQFQYRPTTDSATIGGTGTTSVSLPYWLKFTRSGNTIKGYISADGITWIAKDTLTISMTDPIYMGLAVDNFGNGNLATGIFTDVSIQDGVLAMNNILTPTISDLAAADYIYPNPAWRNAYINLNSLIPEKIFISITDIKGRIILNMFRNLAKGENKIEIPIKELGMASGVYIVNVASATKKFVGKLVIQR